MIGQAFKQKEARQMEKICEQSGQTAPGLKKRCSRIQAESIGFDLQPYGPAPSIERIS